MLAGHTDGPAAVLALLRFDFYAKAAEHVFGVIAGFLRFNHRGRAAGIEARQKDRRFHLRTRHRRFIFDPERIAGARQGERHSPAFLGLKFCAHLRERIDDTLHRALHERGIPREGCCDRVPRHESHQQPRGRAAIAHINHASGLHQAAEARAPDMPCAILIAFYLRAQLPHRLRGGENILAFQEALHAALSDRQRRQHQRAVGHGFITRNADAPG